MTQQESIKRSSGRTLLALPLRCRRSESVPQLARRRPQQTLVTPHRDNAGALFEVAASVRFSEGENAGRASVTCGTGEDVAYHPLHVSVIGVAQMAEGGGKVGRADEDSVHAFDRTDAVEVFKAGPGLDLHQHANLIVHGGEVVRHRAIAVAALRYRYAPDARGRIPCCGYGAAGFLRGFYEGNQEVIESGIQQPLEDDCIVGRWSHNRCTRAILKCHQLRDQCDYVVRRVFGVEQ